MPAGKHRHTGSADRRGQDFGYTGSGVDHGQQRHTGGDQVCRSLPAAVAGGQHHRAASGGHAIAVAICRHRAGQHHAGPVVAIKHDRAFGRAGCQDGLAGNDFPQALAWLARQRHGQVVGHLLDRAVFAIVKPAKHRGAPHDAHMRHGRQRGDRTGHPGRAVLAVNLYPLGQQLPAGHRALVGQNNPQARAPGIERGDQARRSCTHHQHIAKGVVMFVVVGIFLPRQGAKPGGAADQRLVQFFPGFGRPHERLVVEPGDKQRCGQLVDRHQVETQAGPAVLAGGNQAIKQFDRGCPGVGFRPRTLAQGHQRVGFFAARGQHTAWAVVFETAPEQTHPMRQQCRGKRIAGMPGVALAIKSERQCPAAVDQAAMGKAKGLRAHAAGSGRARRASVIAWVTVLRVTRSQLRHPCA